MNKLKFENLHKQLIFFTLMHAYGLVCSLFIELFSRTKRCDFVARHFARNIISLNANHLVEVLYSLDFG